MKCVHGVEAHRCFECQDLARGKATSPVAGPASSASEAKSADGTGQGLATDHLCRGIECEHRGCLFSRHQSPANSKQVGGEHYKVKIQTWDFITANEIPFLEGNAIKYIVRHKAKGGRLDLEKAIHYLQKALEVYYPKDPT